MLLNSLFECGNVTIVCDDTIQVVNLLLYVGMCCMVLSFVCLLVLGIGIAKAIVSLVSLLQ